MVVLRGRRCGVHDSRHPLSCYLCLAASRDALQDDRPDFHEIGTGLWYFFASVNVPLGDRAFSYQPIFAMLYDY